jgi:hypothetical protein
MGIWPLKKRELGLPLLEQAWEELVEHKDFLSSMIKSDLDTALKGQRLSKEIVEWGSHHRVRYIIDGSYVSPPTMDAKRMSATYVIGFDVEDLVMAGTVLLTLRPILDGPKVKFQAYVRRGPNPNAPNFPENTFISDHLYTLPHVVGEYLKRTTLVTQEKHDEPWDKLLEHAKAMDDFLVEMLERRLKGKRLATEVHGLGKNIRYYISRVYARHTAVDVEDRKRKRLLFLISLGVEDVLLKDAIVMAVAPVYIKQKGAWAYKATVAVADDQLPPVPEAAFLDEDVFSFCDRLAKHLVDNGFLLS